MDSASKPIAVALKNVSVSFGNRVLLDNVSAQFNCSQLIALVGRNGTGKSSLMRVMARLDTPSSGEVKLMNLSTPKRHEIAKMLSYVSTRRVKLHLMRVDELVATGRAPMTGWSGTLSKADRRIVDESMSLAGISTLASRRVDSLSDGEAQRAMIARAIAQTTPIILLDEPTSFLDIPARIELCRLLRQLADSGKCVIFSTHELSLAEEWCDRIALIDTPHLTTGTPGEMRQHIARAFDLNSPQLLK